MKPPPSPFQPQHPSKVTPSEAASGPLAETEIIQPEDVMDNNDLKNYFRQRLGTDFDELSFILMDRDTYLELIHGDHALLSKMIMQDPPAANDIFIAFAGDKLNRVVMTLHIETPDVGTQAVTFIRKNKTAPAHETWLKEMEELAFKIQKLHRTWKRQSVLYHKIPVAKKSASI